MCMQRVLGRIHTQTETYRSKNYLIGTLPWTQIRTKPVCFFCLDKLSMPKRKLKKVVHTNSQIN